MNVLTCERNLNCELQRLGQALRIRDLTVAGSRNHFAQMTFPFGGAGNRINVFCRRRCVAVCEFSIGRIYRMVERSFKAIVGPAYNGSLTETRVSTAANV